MPILLVATANPPDELDVITELVSQLDDINVDEVLEVVADSSSVGSVGSIGSSLNICFDRNTNKKSISSRRSSRNSQSINLLLNIDNNSTSTYKNNTFKIEKMKISLPGLITKIYQI